MTTPRLWPAARALFVRDLHIAWRHRADVAMPLIFFALVISLFPLGVGPEPQLLRTMAPGIVWVAALLAGMLAATRLFATDYADGTLEQMLLAPQPLSVLVLAKLAAHWVTSGLLLTLLSPLLALQLNLPATALVTLLVSLTVGTLLLTLLGGIAAALTLGVRGSGVLVPLLVLPLYTPVLIFGAEAVNASAGGFDPQAHLSLLGALLALTASFAPWACAAALRISLD